MPTATTHHGTVKTLLLILAKVLGADAAEERPPATEKLVDRLDVTVDAYCPCGSTHLHHLTLVSTSECARCSRTLAIRSIQYVRSNFGTIPQAQVSVGYVFTPDSLRRRRTTGVH
jgi:hypothetical protein